MNRTLKEFGIINLILAVVALIVGFLGQFILYLSHRVALPPGFENLSNSFISNEILGFIIMILAGIMFVFAIAPAVESENIVDSVDYSDLIDTNKRKISFLIAGVSFYVLAFLINFSNEVLAFVLTVIAAILLVVYFIFIDKKINLAVKFPVVDTIIVVVFLIATFLLYYYNLEFIPGKFDGLEAVLLTLTVSHIQYSHFATVDVLLSLFIMISLYFIIDIFYGNANNKTYIIVAALIGITLAIKITAGPLLVVFGICHLVNVTRKGFTLYKENVSFKDQKFKDLIKFTFITPLWFILIVIAVNFISQPFAYIDYKDFYDRVTQEINLARDASVCYTQQYIGSPFLYYYIKEIILRSMGPPLGILSLLSLVIATISTILKPTKSKHLVLLLWAVPYFISVSTFEAKFLRYLQPLFPCLCLFASYYFLKLFTYLNKNTFQRIVAILLSAILIGYTLFYALAFFSIYMKPHTFITGSLWFNKNVPTSAFILSQHWDEGFPLTQFGKGSEYKVEELQLYEHFGCDTEDDKKVSHLAKFLEKGDYIVAQTRRLYGATANVQNLYPVTTKYFDLLFTNRLGFKLIKEFNSYPSLLGIEINDDLSDESFSVYDHPKILVFKKTKSYREVDYSRMLRSKDPNTLSKNQFLMTHHPENPQIKTYSIVDEILIIVIWWLLLEILSIIGFVFLFLTLKKAGFSNVFFSYLAGLLLFGYTVWILSSLSFIKYSFFYILIVFVILLNLSITYIYSNKTSLLEFFKTNIDIIMFSKLIFLACFILLLIFRLQTPEIYWGEKPMDFGILNNLIRIDHLPADEIWFGGKALNYYYFGHFLFATLSKLTFIPSFFVYNLALATLAALAFLASAGVIYFLTRNILFTVLAGIFTAFWANLSGIREYFYGEYPISFDFFWATSRVIPHTINEYPLWGLLFGDLHAHTIALSIFIFIIYLAVYQFMQLVNTKQIDWYAYGLISFAMGTLAITNTWDIPSACVILLCCILVPIISYSTSTSKKVFNNTILKHIVILILAIITGFILYLPYWLTSKSAYIATLGVISNSETIRINDFLFIWGFFIFIFVSYSAVKVFIKTIELEDSGKVIYSLVLKLLLFITIIILLPLFYFINLTSGFTIVLLILGLSTFLIDNKAESKVITGLFTLGFTMLLFTEIFFIYDHMNTIFKFFLQVWYLFSISSAFLLYELFTSIKLSDLIKSRDIRTITRTVWSFAFIILIGLSLFTTFTAIIGFNMTRRVTTPLLTINGIDYLKFKDPSEYLAVMWLRQNIQDDAIVLEAYGQSYSDYSRIVMNTGIPTLLGWNYHLTQRAVSDKDIKARAADIETIYSSNSSDIAYDLLKKYLVDYIYIGKMEAKAYNKTGFQKFDVNPDKFKLIYSNVNVKIYKIL